MALNRRYYIDKAKELLEEKDKGVITAEQMLDHMDTLEINNEDCEVAEGELYTDA